MSFSNSEQVKKPILIPIVVSIVLLISLAVFEGYQLQKNFLIHSVDTDLHSLKTLFDNLINEESKLISGLIDFYEDNESLQNAYRSNDRKKLQAESAQLYEQINSKYDITHFYFHSLDQTCFLRVHNPPRHSDTINRFTMKQAVRDGTETSGIELGPFGTFTLRVVRPWQVGGHLVGYIELGKEIEHISLILKDILRIELFFTLQKSFLNRHKWEEGMQIIGRQNNWEQFPESVLTSSTLELPDEKLIPFIEGPSESHTSKLLATEINQKHYIGDSVVLKDAENRQVGKIIAFKDYTSEIHSLNRFLIALIIAGMLGGGMLILFFYRRLDRIEENLTFARENLQKQHQELKETHSELDRKNREISSRQRKVQKALNQISKILVQVADKKDFSVRFIHKKLKKCWEEMQCNKQDCPCYDKDPTRCWQVAGTFCKGEVQGTFAQKYKDCRKCAFYKTATSDPTEQIGEQFNNMMHILEAKNKELEDAYSDLESTQAQMLQHEKMASIGVLAAGVAHEINNPISFIYSNFNTLKKYISSFIEFIHKQEKFIDTKPDELIDLRKKLHIDLIVTDAKELINESLDGTERVSTIVKNLKNFSRVDESDKKSTNINECIENTLNIVWNELKYKASVQKELSDLPLLNCYPQQLNQVFTNLLVNAAHAIKENGQITIKTWHADEMIYFSISDTGIGIPKENLSKLFVPFFTTKEVGQGTGLGLSIVYDIVNKHEGEILVDSQIGIGSTFTISLPVS